MAYCTLSDIPLSHDEIVTLSDDSGTGVLDEGVVSGCIAKASGYIDGYLSSYALPLVEVPPMLTVICADLCVYYLYFRRQSNSMPESIMKSYAASVSTLTQIAAGKIGLGLEAQDVPAVSGAYITNKTPLDKTFMADVLSAY